MSQRVLHLIPTLQAGGAEHQLVLLARSLPSFGWDVDIGYVHDGIQREALERTEARLHRFRVHGNYDPSLVVRIMHLIRRSTPAVVQTWLPQMDVAGGLAARILRVPWIVSERSSRPLTGRNVIRILRDAVTGGASAVISNSTDALNAWARRHEKVQKFHVPNALSIKEIDDAPLSSRVAALRDAGGGGVAIGAGRLIEMKRFDVFIEAMKTVCREGPGVGVICGDGPMRSMLEMRARAAGIADRIVFTGFVHDVVSEIKTANVLVALSEFEGRPNVVIEAMAARTPVIVSDIPAHREILNGESARFVEGTDPEEVAAAILDVFRNAADSERRALCARATAEEWCLELVAPQYATIYDQLVRPAGDAA